MKKTTLLLPLLGLLLYVTMSSYSSGPGIVSLELTGVTGSTGCGSGCHGSSATTSTTVGIQLLSGVTPVTSYTPGSSYTIRITGVQTSGSLTLPKFGFQVTSVKASTTTNAGTMTAPTGGHIATVSGVSVAEHSSALTATTGSGGSGTTYVVNVPWTAPIAGTGTVRIRSVINAVNASTSDDAGDKWNLATPLDITETTTTTITPITGVMTVCVGNTTTLSNATPGGTWSSANPAIATVGASSGIVTGMGAGTVVISYNAGTSGIATATVTVNPLPSPITGFTSVCVGSTTTLSDASGGGTWISGSSSIATIGSSSGLVTGIAAGSSPITYTLATGCRALATVTVLPVPPAIIGTATVCAGSTTTLTDAVSGGTWSSTTLSVATVGSSTGIVTGVSAGTSDINYTLPTGCFVAQTVTVQTTPTPAAIAGPTVVCVGSTITLTDATPGGTWTSLHTAFATVGSSTGIVTGVAVGVDTIVYTVTNGCGSGSVSYPIAIHALGTCATSVFNAGTPFTGMTVYPNPNKGSFFVNLQSAKDEDASFVITDIVGKKIKEFNGRTNDVMNISMNHPAGIYFITASSPSGNFESKMIIE